MTLYGGTSIIGQYTNPYSAWGISPNAGIRCRVLDICVKWNSADAGLGRPTSTYAPSSYRTPLSLDGSTQACPVALAITYSGNPGAPAQYFRRMYSTSAIYRTYVFPRGLIVDDTDLVLYNIGTGSGTGDVIVTIEV
jgi:hypothetical protein